MQLQAVFAYGGKVFATGNAGDVLPASARKAAMLPPTPPVPAMRYFRGWVVITVVCMVNVIERNFLYSSCNCLLSLAVYRVVFIPSLRLLSIRRVFSST